MGCRLHLSNCFFISEPCESKTKMQSIKPSPPGPSLPNRPIPILESNNKDIRRDQGIQRTGAAGTVRFAVEAPVVWGVCFPSGFALNLVLPVPFHGGSIQLSRAVCPTQRAGLPSLAGEISQPRNTRKLADGLPGSSPVEGCVPHFVTDLFGPKRSGSVAGWCSTNWKKGRGPDLATNPTASRQVSGCYQGR
jgi:hypothetical protein